MARKRRKTHSRRRHSLSASPRRSVRRRRRSGMAAGIGGLFSNPIVGATVGASLAGVVGGFLSKPGSSGKPFIESPVMRAAIAAGVVYVAGKALKSPAVSLGGVAVGAFAIVKNSNILGANFSLSDGAQINYVDPALLSEPATLAEYSGVYAATGY